MKFYIRISVYCLIAASCLFVLYNDYLTNIGWAKEQLVLGKIQPTNNVKLTETGFISQPEDSQIKQIQAEIKLEKDQDYYIEYKLDSLTGGDWAEVHCDFYGPGYDSWRSEFAVFLSKNDRYKKVSGIINSDAPSPDSQFRIFYASPPGVSITNIKVYRLNQAYSLLQYLLYGGIVVAILLLAFTLGRSSLRGALSGTVCVIIPSILLFFLFTAKKPYGGDSFEYLLMSEAIFNHGSPDITAADVAVFDKKFDHTYFWISKDIGYLFNEPTFMKSFAGFYTNLQGKHFSYHFWFYPLLNLPARYLVQALNINPERAFQITHALILFIVVLVVYYSKRLTEKEKILLLILYIISPGIFYLPLAHPEFLVYSLMFLSGIFLLERRYLLAILLSAVAAMQNLPLGLFGAFIILLFLYKKGFTVKNLCKSSFAFLPALIPPVFYIYNYQTPSLIASTGFLNLNFTTLEKLFSLFFDLNQGLLIGMPVLLLVIGVLIWKARRVWKEGFKNNLTVHDGILPVALVIALVSCTMMNWNAGQQVIHRYGIWVAPLFLIYLVAQKNFINRYLLAFILVIQLAVVVHYKGFYAEGEYVKHKGIAKFFLRHAPSLYNPVPEVFAERTLGFEGVEASHSPIIYYHNGKITKMMVHRDDPKFFYGQKVASSREWIYINP